MSTGQYANLGLAARRPVRLRTVAEGAGRAASGADQQQQHRFDEPVDGAERAFGDQSSAQTTLNDLDGLDARRQFRRVAPEHRPVGAAVADRLGQRDVGRPICVRRNQFRRRAAGGLLFDPRLRRQDRGRPGLSDRLRRPAERSGGGEHLGVGDAELSFRAVRGAVSGAVVERELVVGLERRTRAPRSRRVRR